MTAHPASRSHAPLAVAATAAVALATALAPMASANAHWGITSLARQGRRDARPLARLGQVASLSPAQGSRTEPAVQAAGRRAEQRHVLVPAQAEREVDAERLLGREGQGPQGRAGRVQEPAQIGRRCAGQGHRSAARQVHGDLPHARRAVRRRGAHGRPQLPGAQAAQRRQRRLPDRAEDADQVLRGAAAGRARGVAGLRRPRPGQHSRSSTPASTTRTPTSAARARSRPTRRPRARPAAGKPGSYDPAKFDRRRADGTPAACTTSPATHYDPTRPTPTYQPIRTRTPTRSTATATAATSRASPRVRRERRRVHVHRPVQHAARRSRRCGSVPAWRRWPALRYKVFGCVGSAPTSSARPSTRRWTRTATATRPTTSTSSTCRWARDYGSPQDGDAVLTNLASSSACSSSTSSGNGGDLYDITGSPGDRPCGRSPRRTRPTPTSRSTPCT